MGLSSFVTYLILLQLWSHLWGELLEVHVEHLLNFMENLRSRATVQGMSRNWVISLCIPTDLFRIDSQYGIIIKLKHPFKYLGNEHSEAGTCTRK